MIILLIILLLIVIAVYSRGKNLDVCIGTTVFALVLSCFMALTAWSSWDNTGNLKAKYDGYLANYNESIELYEDIAVLDINENTFTDFRYQGYQDNISEMIIDLRNSVIKYNRMFVKKQWYDDNIVFGLFIFAPPDDCKLVHINTKTKSK